MPRGKKIVTYQLVPVDPKVKKTRNVYNRRVNKANKSLIVKKYCPENRKHIEYKLKEIKHSS